MKFIRDKKSILLVLPVLYFITACLFIYYIRPFYSAYFDPTYVYLLNGTDIASGHFIVGNIIHPGTPVDILTAIVIFVKHLFAGDKNILYQDVLLHPESYLLACSIVLIVLFVHATYFAGRYIYSHTGNLLLALLFQLPPLLYREMVQRTVLLSAESLMVIVNMYFMPYIYIHTIYRKQLPGREITIKSVLFFGLFTALLFTIKVYCGLFCLLILFLLNNWRQRILYLISHTALALLLLFPVYRCFRDWLGTMKSTVFHQGAYGQGSSGLINTVVYRNNILAIVTTHYIFCLVYLFVIVAFVIGTLKVLRDKKGIPGFISPITGIFLFFTLFIFMIAKQYTIIYPEPVTHELITITKYYYFIPLIGCFPLFLLVAYQQISLYKSFNFFGFNAQKAGYALLFVFVIIGGIRTYGSCYMARTQDITPEATSAFLEKWKSTPLIIVSDGNKSCVQPALFLGIAFSGPWGVSEYTDFVKKIYPDTYLYTTYNNELVNWGEKSDISSILKKNKQTLVYVSGKDSATTPLILAGIGGGKYSKIYNNSDKYENIYLLKPDTVR